MKIAVTGNIGSGKSTTSRILANSLGALLLNSDEICRMELTPGREGMISLERIYGSRFLRADGSLHREKLRDAVFTEDEVKKTLEAVLHPLVRKEIAVSYDLLRQDKKVLVVEVPLLYETGMETDFDSSVVVRVERAVAIHRVAQRDKLEPVQIEKIMDSQWPIEQKANIADFVIDNSGIMVSTFQQIGWLTRKLLRQL